MGKGNLISMEGTVIEDLSNNKYKVELDNGFIVTYDVTNGRIVYRKNGK